MGRSEKFCLHLTQLDDNWSFDSFCYANGLWSAQGGGRDFCPGIYNWPNHIRNIK